MSLAIFSVAGFFTILNNTSSFMCVYARDDSVISLVGILSSFFLFFFFFFLVNELVDKGGI